MLVTVMGATGKTGKVVTERLLASGVKVRALGRSAETLAPLVKAGAEAVVTDATRADALTGAFRGVDAVYAMVPPNPSAPDILAFYAQVNEAIMGAVRDSGVRRVAYLSSLGAELPAGTGPVVGLHRGEELLKKIPGLDLLLLRPGYFYENHFGAIGVIKSQGVNGGVTKPEVPVIQIATRDIGEIAAKALLARDFSGTVVRELVGPRDLTMAEATRILGATIGKPDLNYVQFPDQGMLAGLQAAGFSENVSRLFVELSHAFNQRKVVAHQPRTSANTGSTTFETFAQGWARAYAGAH